MQIPESIRAYASINLDNLRHNFSLIKSALPQEVGLLAVVKADAYGHSAADCAHALEDEAEYFAVAEPEEAYSLRNENITKPILILGYSHPLQAQKLADNYITQCCFSLDYARKLSASLPAGKRLKIHIKLNTGMTRLGFDCTNSCTPNEVMEVSELKNLEIEGVFAHYAVADDFSEDYTELQLSRFKKTVSEIEKLGISFKYKHHSNSAGCLFGDNDGMNLARAGIMMYGSYPSREVGERWEREYLDKRFKPVMSLYGRIAQIREISEGTTIGYGRTFTAPSERKIAIVTLGYADGMPRLASNRASVISKEIRLTGRVCMDMLFADITDSKKSFHEDELVEVFGEHSLPVEELSDAAETISYVVFCNISKRIPRVIVSDGKIKAIRQTH